MNRFVVLGSIVVVLGGWGCAGKTTSHHAERTDALDETKDQTTVTSGRVDTAAEQIARSTAPTQETPGLEVPTGPTVGNSTVGSTLTTPSSTIEGSATTGPSTVGEEAAAGKACGARAGDTCRKTEYCAYVPGQYCGQADAQATCKPRPEACTQQYDPVCGCDGKTYGNACSAASAGVGVFDKGECESTTPKPRDCETFQCLRPYTCAKSCTDEVVHSGCCPCPEGYIDTFVECPR